MAKDKHIIDWALESLDLDIFDQRKDSFSYRLIFVVRLEHINNFAIDTIIKDKFGSDNVEIVICDHDTDGAVSTCLLAEDLISGRDGLMIYTPDVYFQKPFNVLNKMGPDGHILTFKANSPAHSYVRKDEECLSPNYENVIETREKEVISNEAAVGVYYFDSGDLFLHYAHKMIDQDLRSKGEFYICPIYDLMAKDGKTITTSLVDSMHVLGTPEELRFFVDNVSPEFGDRPVALCCDHSGYTLKEQAKKVLESNDIKYIDFGCYKEKGCDYGDYVIPAAKELTKRVDFVMGFCRTGQGINILANRLPNVRAALVFDEYTTEYAIRHNCANFFSIPSKYVDISDLSQMVKKMKETSFEGGRHMTRMSKTMNEAKKNN
jgi:RpiB/LacA/LacB family sugar-phosphate isomerase